MAQRSSPKSRPAGRDAVLPPAPGPGETVTILLKDLDDYLKLHGLRVVSGGWRWLQERRPTLIVVGADQGAGPDS